MASCNHLINIPTFSPLFDQFKLDHNIIHYYCRSNYIKNIVSETDLYKKLVWFFGKMIDSLIKKYSCTAESYVLLLLWPDYKFCYKGCLISNCDKYVICLWGKPNYQFEMIHPVSSESEFHRSCSFLSLVSINSSLSITINMYS